MKKIEENEKIITAKIKLERLLYPKTIKQVESDGGFCIFSAKLIELLDGSPAPKLHHTYGTFSVKGMCGSIDYCSTYKLVAKEVVDSKYGLGYEIIFINPVGDLGSVAGQKTYLSNVLTDNQLDELFKTFENPLEIIKENDVKRLCEVKGIGPATAIKIVEKVLATEDYSTIFIELDKYDLSLNMIKRLLERYKSPKTLITKVKENPYILASEVSGIGLKKADAIALASGMHPLSNYRIQAFITNYLETVSDREGHLWVRISSLVEFLERSIKTLTKEHAIKVIKAMIENHELHYDKDKKIIGLYKYYKLEEGIACEINRLVGANVSAAPGWEDRVQKLEKRQSWEFNSQQREGIKAIINNPITIITGAGGTGKTSAVSGVLAALGGIDFAQCSLSGKAASRLQEVTGQEGLTIHRLLGWKGGNFTFNADCRLHYDMILLDESSMVGGKIFYQLLQAIKTGARLVMLGDINQLEAIGTGSTFKDIIDSGKVKVITLTEVMRQAKRSGIITGSFDISQGVQITDEKFVGTKVIGELQDFEVTCIEDGEEVLLPMIACYKKYIEQAGSILELQLITPKKTNGKTCVKNINTVIQKLYNPPAKGLNEYEFTFKKEVLYTLREGDKVINRANNYKSIDTNGTTCPIYNGNIGIIESIDYDTMIINFGGIGRVVLEKKFWKNIQLAYCITTHLAQGSQFDYVIYGFDFGAYVLLTKEQIYTGVSRAKKHCTLISTNKALHFGIDTSKIPTKQTFLRGLLTDGKTEEEEK